MKFLFPRKASTTKTDSTTDNMNGPVTSKKTQLAIFILYGEKTQAASLVTPKTKNKNKKQKTSSILIPHIIPVSNIAENAS